MIPRNRNDFTVYQWLSLVVLKGIFIGARTVLKYSRLKALRRIMELLKMSRVSGVLTITGWREKESLPSPLFDSLDS